MNLTNPKAQAIQNLRKQHELLRPHIVKRLKELKKFYSEPYCWHYENNKMILKPGEEDHNKRIFQELCFCLLTANTSARAGLKAIHTARDKLLDGSLQELQHSLVMAGYRYPNKRAEYIVHARDFLSRELNFKLKEKLESLDFDLRRDFVVQNIKGLGYKEASHFLRNIGFSGYAILDKHVLNTLCDLGYLDKNSPPNNKAKYIDIEQKVINLAKDTTIDIDELDFVLWANKTGEILK